MPQRVIYQGQMENKKMNFPNKKYKIIYADPPWEYHDKLKSHGGGASQHFDEMSTEDICKLPVKQITDDNCILFCWGTWTHNRDIHKVIDAWGFDYKTCGFVWVKVYKTGAKMLGMGRYTRSNTEYCLIATKGKSLERLSKKVRQVFEEIDEGNWTPERIKTDVLEHSEKPNIFRTRIIDLLGDLPRIELFARTKVHGWDTWGNDEKLHIEPLEKYL